jgi:DNA-binding response OmpR family regulator
METALIIEDDRDQAEVAAQLLRMRNLRPLIAPTGTEGLELAQTHPLAVILLDLMLPDIHGIEICRRLRSRPETRMVPIIMLTALGGGENRLRGFWVGATSYVTKPYSAQELFDALAAAHAWKDDLHREQVQGEIQVELNSESTFLKEVNTFLEDQFSATPLSTEQVQQMRQAVLEMGQNAIEWGNKSHVEKLVRIRYRVYGDRIEVVIKDQGAGFNPKNLTHAASSDDPLKHMDVREQLGLREGGFGLLISKGMVDEMRHNSVGNEVTLVKRFLPEPPEPSGAVDPRTEPA